MIYYTQSKGAMTWDETGLRTKLIYKFNPCLKYLMGKYGMNKFMQYGFNSCRQTAVLGAAFAKLELPDAEVNVYEADFKDIVNGSPVEYTHAYFRVRIPPDKLLPKRDWLVDISRTERPLLFTETVPGTIYPHTGTMPEYMHAKIVDIRHLPLDDMIHMSEPEYVTNMWPIDLLTEVCQTVFEMSTQSQEWQKDFVEFIYSRFTKLRLGRNEFIDQLKYVK